MMMTVSLFKLPKITTVGINMYKLLFKHLGILYRQ